MSTDVIADALLPTCESIIKSLSQILSTLHSIDALGRLKEKADVVAAFAIIASFAPFLVPPHLPTTLTTINDDGSLTDARVERVEQRAEISSHDRLVVPGRFQGDATTAHTHTKPRLAQPHMLEAGRDDVILPREEILSSSQSSAFGTSNQRVVPLEHLIHPERQSERARFASKERPLYSFLIHFPIFRAFGAKLSIVDRAELFSLPAMEKWGFGDSMATFAYPRLRLTNGGTTYIVVADDPERVEEMKKDLEEAEQELWDKGAMGMLDRTFFFVGTWREEPHVALVFSMVGITFNRSLGLGHLERWTTPDGLWKDISKIYPILSHFQERVPPPRSGQEGVKGRRDVDRAKYLGARLCYRESTSTTAYGFFILVVPFLGCPHALIFANDFVDHHSPFLLAPGGVNNQPASSTAEIGQMGVGTLRVNVRIAKMGPPSLKDDDEHWDGGAFRSEKWLDARDTKIH